MSVRMGGKFVFCSYRWALQHLSSLFLKEFRDGTDSTVSDRVFHRFTVLCLKKFRRCLFVHLFLEFVAVASCICLRFKFEWHMEQVVEAMHIFVCFDHITTIK